jgi:RNA polymerase sigma-70 factor (ECF subfamily)
MTSGRDERTLIEACRAGETEAFGTLVQMYQDRLFPPLLRLTGCADDAADILQDAFLKAFQKLDDFHGESSFYTWVYRIAVNLALSDKRRNRRAPSSLTGTGDSAFLDPSDDPDRTDPAAPLELAERETIIQAALLELAPEFRAVVVLKDVDGLRYEQIAAILEIPIGTVRSRLHRAREELRNRLSSLLGDRGGRNDRPRPVAAIEGDLNKNTK